MATKHDMAVDCDVVVNSAEQEPTFGTKFSPYTVIRPPPYVFAGFKDTTVGGLLTTMKGIMAYATIFGSVNVTLVK